MSEITACMVHSLREAIAQRDAYFYEAARTKDTLATIIPALELASGLKAEQFHEFATGELTRDEVAALWLARAIMEAPIPAALPHS